MRGWRFNFVKLIEECKETAAWYGLDKEVDAGDDG